MVERPFPASHTGERNNRRQEGFRFVGFPLAGRIGNDVPAFNTAYFTGGVLFFRDVVGDQTTMCTGVGRAQWEGLWGLL